MVRRQRHRRMTAVESTYTVIATICFLPCICAIGGGIIAGELFSKARNYERRKKRWQREGKERWSQMMRTSPKTLEPRLERHLTIGRPEPKSKDCEGEEWQEGDDVKASKMPAATGAQRESLFFKLPLEIRRKIYGEVLGHHVIHIYFVEAYRKMSHTRCKLRFPDVCRRLECRHNIKIRGAQDQWGNISLLPLLQSCRRM